MTITLQATICIVEPPSSIVLHEKKSEHGKSMSSTHPIIALLSHLTGLYAFVDVWCMLTVNLCPHVISTNTNVYIEFL